MDIWENKIMHKKFAKNTLQTSVTLFCRSYSISVKNITLNSRGKWYACFCCPTLKTNRNFLIEKICYMSHCISLGNINVS